MVWCTETRMNPQPRYRKAVSPYKRKKVKVSPIASVSKQTNPHVETNSCSASQGITCTLWSQNVHYDVHKNPPLKVIPSLINLVPTLATYNFNTHFKIILPSWPRTRKCPLLLRFDLLTKALDARLVSPFRTTFPATLILPDLMTVVVGKIMNPLIM